jgi:hypothetical protein
MNASQWAIVMLVTLAAAAATPSWGQDVVPTAVPANTRGIQGAASIPDLSYGGVIGLFRNRRHQD